MNRRAARYRTLAGAGFTLLELLIAVAVLAISMAALLGGFARYADQAAYLKTRTVALWVAHDVLTDEELQAGWPAEGTREGETELAGQIWEHRLEVVTTEADNKLRRLDVKVYAPGADEDNPRTVPMAQLTAFLSCVGRGGC